MNDEQHQNTGELRSQYQTYDRQKCFIAYSEQAHWSTDFLEAASEVLSEPEFNLEPDYARKYFESDISLRQKAVELIANARYGIYDLSWWRQDDRSSWQMPRNVFIELGIAIALNRPTILLRNKEAELRRKKEVGLELPDSLQCLGNQILEFSGKRSLGELLRKHLPTWVGAAPEKAWWNRYCIFGDRVCEYRETHPCAKQFGQNTLNCSIADGADSSRPDFRDIVENVLTRDHNINYIYFDALSFEEGYNFLLCTYCQKIRSSSFAIYRITSETPPEAFIAIGITLAIETQFKYTIPKILITEDKQIVPSLLSGYEVIEAKSDKEKKDKLKKFIPEIIRKVRKTTWKPKLLPFIDILRSPYEEPQQLVKNNPILSTQKQQELKEKIAILNEQYRAVIQRRQASIDPVEKFQLAQQANEIFNQINQAEENLRKLEIVTKNETNYVNPKGESFDVFLCHNSKDKAEVKQIQEQLIKLGIKPWLDEWEIRPGFPWQRTLEKQIENIKAAAVFVGSSGLAPWQELEIDAFLREFVQRQCPVIPVLLSTAPDKPKLPIFLSGQIWVDFRQKQPDPMTQLIWGITGNRP